MPEPTELVLLVTTNLRVPEQLDAIRVEATGPDGRTRTSTARLDGDDSLPVSLRLVHETGALAPLTVDVIAEREGADVLVRSAAAAFVAGERRILAMPLLAECRDVRCEEGATCTEAGCSDVQVSPEQLPRYDETSFSELSAPPAPVPLQPNPPLDAAAPEDAGVEPELDAATPDADAAADVDAADEPSADGGDAGDAPDAGDCERELVCRGACVVLTIPGLCDCTLECVRDAGAAPDGAQG